MSLELSKLLRRIKLFIYSNGYFLRQPSNSIKIS